MPATEGAYYQNGSGPPYGQIYRILGGKARRLTDWSTYQTLTGNAGNPQWGMWWNGSAWVTPQGTAGTPNPGWAIGVLPAGTPMGTDITSVADGQVATAPVVTPPGSPGPNPVWPSTLTASGAAATNTTIRAIPKPLLYGGLALVAYAMFSGKRR